MVEFFIWKYGLYILIIWTMLDSSCSTKEGGLPYQPPEYAPIYKEECYLDYKNILCWGKPR